MKITKRSILSGKVHTMELDVTDEELQRWAAGAHAQDVWPDMKPELREFIISGSTPEEWDHWFPKDCEEDDE